MGNTADVADETMEHTWDRGTQKEGALAVIALIPARGGSKGIPGKNLRTLCGRPLIHWSIAQALACDEIDRVVVSTDDEEIAGVARQSGAETPFLRPAALASDSATTEVALLHALAALKADSATDCVVLLQPTSPVRAKGSVLAAIEHFRDSGADSLVSLGEVHPFVWRPGRFFEPQYDPQQRPRRQDLQESDRLYVENGSIYISTVDAVRQSGCRISGRIAGFPMLREECVDIDEEIDFTIAEALMTHMGIAE